MPTSDPRPLRRTDENPVGWAGDAIDETRCVLQRADQCPVTLEEDEIARRFEDDAPACEACCNVLGFETSDT